MHRTVRLIIYNVVNVIKQKIKVASKSKINKIKKKIKKLPNNKKNSKYFCVSKILLLLHVLLYLKLGEGSYGTTTNVL